MESYTGAANAMADGTLFLFVVLGLYRLLKDVDRNLASVMVILGGIIPLPITLRIVLLHYNRSRRRLLVDV